jgi:DNA-binding winged helix-turn-helix (wHTH) protein
VRIGFADLIFDSDAKELICNGEPVALSPKAFQALEALIESRPAALSKSQLHDRLWPNTFVVEANLSNLIGEVRRALHDDPHTPKFVRTVHRYGYAFRAEAVDLHRSDVRSVVCRVVWAGGAVMLREGDHVVGRDPEVAVLLDSPSVSRRHARIRVRNGEATFEDLGSKNGSRVRGQPVHGPVLLSDGDVMTAGIVELTFRVLRPAVATESLR